MIDIIAKIAEVSVKGFEKLSEAAGEVRQKVSNLDKPLNTESAEIIKDVSRHEELLDKLDKPLNADIAEAYENEMADEISKAIKNMLNNEGIDTLREKYTNLDSELSNIQNELQSAETPAERLAAINKLDQTKGRIMEDMIKEALSDYFDLFDEKQVSIETAEGITKPDIIFAGAKEDIKIGGTEINKGEGLGVEVKCGSDVYIRSQTNHIFTQVLGHGDNSVVIVSKEFNGLTDGAKNNLINGLKERNSSLCVLDIESTEVKKALLNNVMSKVQ